MHWEIPLKLCAALVLALPIAWDRERHSRVMGLRTFPLVAAGACAYLMIGIGFIGEGHPDAKARVLQGLLAGIGFIGGGAILKQGDRVKGTASAVSIWMTGALGAAVAFDFWLTAITVSVLNLIVLLIFGRLKKIAHHEDT